MSVGNFEDGLYRSPLHRAIRNDKDDAVRILSGEKEGVAAKFARWEREGETLLWVGGTGEGRDYGLVEEFG